MNAKEIIELIKLNDVNVRQVEKDLDIPHGCISIAKEYVSSKYTDVIGNYLSGMSVKAVDLPIIKNSDNDVGTFKKRLKYNEGRVPDFGDGIWRYRDPDNGLWKRVIDWHYAIKKDEQGNKVKDRLGNDVRTVKESWQPSDDVVHKDKIGEFYVANNGEKVYLFNK